jgi:hypothetical protein
MRRESQRMANIMHSHKGSQEGGNMFGSGFLALFAALFDDDEDDLDCLEENEDDRRKRGDLPRGDQDEEE